MYLLVKLVENFKNLHLYSTKIFYFYFDQNFKIILSSKEVHSTTELF